MSSVLEVTGLSAGYGSAPVVRGIDMSLAQGEMVAMLGANGAGKTTTLLAISGFLEALAGEVRIMGNPVVGRPHEVARRGLAHVPEDRSAIFRGLTVRENLQLGCGGDDRVERALDLFPELSALLGRSAGLLSGGEQQMLALGRAIAGRPKVLLVDEMSLGLAPLVVDRCFAVLREVARADGVAVLFVEQHIRLALRAADRAYVLRHGELIMQGQARDLLADAATLEASYFGTTDDARRKST
jgi:branched-chain amino acid transport system ATP-binding protein